MWTQTYLLGTMSEMDEVLREINWKVHRQMQSPPIVENIGWELADMFKYVISIAELWGFTPEQFLQFVANKTKMLALQRDMDEFLTSVEGENIITADLDGTLADWRKSFHIWFQTRQTKGQLMETDPLNTLSYDVDAAVAYPDYLQRKLEFEETGGYASLLPFKDAIASVKNAQEKGAKLVVYTARPQSQLKRVWWDTYTWLLDQGIVPDALKIGAEARILGAYALSRKKKNQVVMLEDNPGLALRAANAGMTVYLRNMPYNRDIEHQNIRRLYLFPTEHDYFPGGGK